MYLLCTMECYPDFSPRNLMMKLFLDAHCTRVSTGPDLVCQAWFAGLCFDHMYSNGMRVCGCDSRGTSALTSLCPLRGKCR